MKFAQLALELKTPVNRPASQALSSLRPAISPLDTPKAFLESVTSEGEPSSTSTPQTCPNF